MGNSLRELTIPSKILNDNRVQVVYYLKDLNIFFLQWCYFFLILSYNFFKNTFQSFRLKIIFILLNVRNMYCWPPVVIKSLISVTSKILQYIRFILVSMWLNILENNTVGPRILIYLKNTFIVKIIKNELNMSEMFFQHYTTSIYQFIK